MTMNGREAKPPDVLRDATDGHEDDDDDNDIKAQNELNDLDITERGQVIASVSVQIWSKILDKFGKGIADKFLKDISQEEKDSFVKRLKETQIEKFTDRLALIFNRTITDYHFLKSYKDIMRQHKTTDELKQDIEIANNHLQSVENERSILQRDTDMALDEIEIICEAILENTVGEIPWLFCQSIKETQSSSLFRVIISAAN